MFGDNCNNYYFEPLGGTREIQKKISLNERLFLLAAYFVKMYFPGFKRFFYPVGSIANKFQILLIDCDYSIIVSKIQETQANAPQTKKTDGDPV